MLPVQKVANPWISFVKTYHVEKGITYRDALRSIECQEAYRSSKSQRLEPESSKRDRLLTAIESRPDVVAGSTRTAESDFAVDHIRIQANEPLWFVAVFDVVDKITNNFTSGDVFESIRTGGDRRVWNEYWSSVPSMNPMVDISDTNSTEHGPHGSHGPHGPHGSFSAESIPASLGREFAKHVFTGIQLDRQFRLSDYWDLVLERQKFGSESFGESQLNVLRNIFEKLP